MKPGDPSPQPNPSEPLRLLDELKELAADDLFGSSARLAALTDPPPAPRRKETMHSDDPSANPSPSGSLRDDQLDGELSLGELLANLWDGRYLILGAFLLALLLGGYYAWRKTPIYQLSAMLQIEDKKATMGGASTMALQGLFDQPTVAQAEIEIIRSNLVLGRAVEALSLDIVATPAFNLLTGNALVRHRPDAPELLVKRFDIPAFLKGKDFRIVAQVGGAFRWEGPKGEPLATGMVGEDVKATYQGQPLLLQLDRLTAPPGQGFHLSRQPMFLAIEGLRKTLGVGERGKLTNILGLSFEHRDPVRGAEILNEILHQYVNQNIERKAEEASKTLAFVQEQMPQVKGKLEVAEERLNQYRRSSGAVDLTEEAKLLLKQSGEMEGQALVLQQKKQELMRTYTQRSDVVETLDQQIAKLTSEARQLEGKVRGLPRTQQEVVRFMREVQVNNDLYTALLTSAQQLQVSKAGEIGNARIVDYAMPSLEPIQPNKTSVMGTAAGLGLLIGLGLAILRRLLHRGLEDPRLIESRLGLPVVVTIPHSQAQPGIQKAQERQGAGAHLLALEHPEDLAIESLRSLHTSLHFTMMDARNRVVLISGPSPAIGKSFVSANLATVVAQTGARVLLVDGDMRKGHLHLPFHLERGEGLSNLLSGQRPWREVVQQTPISGLRFISSGELPPNPVALLMASRLAAFIHAVSDEYDLVILDAPPVMAVTDPVILAGQAGTTFLLAKAGAHPLEELRVSLQRFENAGVQVKGCIFNDVPETKVGYRYYRYAYHYGYKK